ncbi:MAG: 23S rRNA (adenine(2503)-C(2))-methyltransferase RlmN [Alphaproteobacteria bacterium]|nr:23S rRNA (adenine(2503)-C(2))-methyltransferase RlmN [Alphaproteobacteria bacterium]
MTSTDLWALDEAELTALLKRWGQPAFRARQIRGWLYDRGAVDVAAMTDLPKGLREQLAAEARVGSGEVVAEQVSKDGTRKRLLRFPDGQTVESVLMPYEDGRRTACISTQAGCAMGCVFCATGQMGLSRHLRSDEIVEQALRFAAELRADGHRLSNVVLMGMGEPFHNYDQTLVAIRRLMSDLGIGARHVTVSTVGLVPQIRRFAQEGLQVRLAVSLHAATDEERSALLPANRRWPIAELMEACRDYAAVTGRRVTFEWALIAGKNDDAGTAHRLGELLKGLPAHVNLIPLNPTPGYDGQPTRLPDADRFVAALAEHGVPATVRVRRGIDIDAGCGQLRATVQRRARAAT